MRIPDTGLTMTERQQAFYELAPRIVDLTVSNNGLIEFADRRLVLFHTEMFAKLFQNMEDVAGPVIQRKIEDFGEQAGKTIANRLDTEFKEANLFDQLKLILQAQDMDKLRKISDTSDLAQIEKIFGLGTYDGWAGNIDIVEYEENERMVLEAENTFESSSYGETGQKQCRFLTGVIAGILEYFWETDVTADETACACEGGDTCQVEATAENA